MTAYQPLVLRFRAIGVIVDDLALRPCAAAGALHFSSASTLLRDLQHLMPETARQAGLGLLRGVSPTPIVRAMDLLPELEQGLEAIGLDPELGGADRRRIAERVRIGIDTALAVLGHAPPGFRAFDLDDLSAPATILVERRFAEAEDAVEPEANPPPIEPPPRRRFSSFSTPRAKVVPS